MRLLGRRSGLLYAGSGRESPAARAARYGLVSAWNLSDTTDAYGTNTLTNNNVATFAAGKIGNAVQLVSASSQSLSVADNTSLRTGEIDFWGCGWVNFDTVVDLAAFFGKANTGATREWQVMVNASKLEFRLFYSDGTDQPLGATTFGNVTTATWYFVFGWFDSVGQTLNIKVNNGAPDSVAKTGGKTVAAGASSFKIGRNQTFGTFHSGRVDGVAFGKQPPAGIATLATEISTYLYNSGSGREWPWT